RRAYAPVTMAREVVKETQINGCTFKPGEMVLLSFPAANRDPEMFPDADKVIIDRKENRHAAFGLGIHRCVGSNLARMEMTVAVEEFLKRIPEFELAGEVTWSTGAVRGPRPGPGTFGRLRPPSARAGPVVTSLPRPRPLGQGPFAIIPFERIRASPWRRVRLRRAWVRTWRNPRCSCTGERSRTCRRFRSPWDHRRPS